MRIDLVEVSEEVSVRQVLQPRGVISHNVFHAGKVGDFDAVAVPTLVLAGHVAEFGSWAIAGDCTFVVARHSWGVVREGLDGGVTDVQVVDYDVDLSMYSGLFEVTVVESAVRVVCADKVALDFFRERLPPQVTGEEGKEDSPHAWFCGICGSKDSWVFGHKFG